MSLSLRPTTIADLPFLKRMLYEAFFWDPVVTRPDYDVFSQVNKEFKKLQADWGRTGDCAVIAEVDGQSAGAAWYRFWTEAVHSYGYVDPQIPEIGLGVQSHYRRQGIGRALLRNLLDTAMQQGIARLSLSVDPRNPARRLYESEGFVKYGEVGTSWTMIWTGKS
jgi:ribosomal protein S18 acetylase RimI-like enzyme